jgi:hypothetical protein
VPPQVTNLGVDGGIEGAIKASVKEIEQVEVRQTNGLTPRWGDARQGQPEDIGGRVGVKEGDGGGGGVGRRSTGETPETSDIGRSRGARESEAVHDEELGLGLIKALDSWALSQFYSILL